MKNKKGFTLIELLIVVAIIGIIAAIAIPNLLRALQNGKQTRTLGDMKSVATGIEMYRTQVQFLPDTGGSITAEATYLAITALATITGEQRATKDGWGRDFYIDSARDDDTYSVGSPGKPIQGDAAQPDFTQVGAYIVLSMNNFSFDLVYSNGKYTYSPKNQ